MRKKSNRHRTFAQKVKTPFGTHYIHIEINAKGQPVGGWISNPGKNPTSAISAFSHELSKGLNECLKGIGT